MELGETVCLLGAEAAKARGEKQVSEANGPIHIFSSFML